MHCLNVVALFEPFRASAWNCAVRSEASLECLLCARVARKVIKRTLIARVPFISKEGDAQHLEMIERMINNTTEDD